MLGASEDGHGGSAIDLHLKQQTQQLPKVTATRLEWLRSSLEIIHPGHRWSSLLIGDVA